MKPSLDGGSAFPLVDGAAADPFAGLTKRDYFAAAALTGMMGRLLDSSVKTQLVAETCYEIADAMLVQREKVEPGSIDTAPPTTSQGTTSAP